MVARHQIHLKRTLGRELYHSGMRTAGWRFAIPFTARDRCIGRLMPYRGGALPGWRKSQ